jgi:hypothetical protein
LDLRGTFCGGTFHNEIIQMHMHIYHLNRKHKQLNLRGTFYVEETYTFK